MGEAADEDEDASSEHACPEHPSSDVLGACSRCGTYYCSECLEEADRPPDSSRCATCPIEVPEPRPFGGWLLLPALQLIVNAIQVSRHLVSGAQTLASTAYTEAIPALAFEELYTAAFLGLDIVAAHHFFRKKKSAINLMLGLYLAAVVVTLLDLAMAYYVEHALGLESPVDAGTVRGLIGPAIWIGYFTNSKRVRETFVVE